MKLYRELVWVFTAAWVLAFWASFFINVSAWWIVGFMIGWVITIGLSTSKKAER